MKKIIKQITLLIGLSLLVFEVSAQCIDTSYIANYDSTRNFYVLKKSIYQNGTSTFQTNSLRMANSLSLVLAKIKTDQLNFTHHKYFQAYQGVTIVGSEFYVHENTTNNIYTANGKLIQTLSINTTPQISGNSAINSAINTCGATTYYWNDNISKSANYSDSLNVDTAYYPKPKLVIINATPTSVTPTYKLAYKVRLYARMPATTNDYYMDANTGALVTKISVSASNCHNSINNQYINVSTDNTSAIQPLAVTSCNNPCQQNSASVKFYGSQYIYTDQFTYAAVLCRYRTKYTCSGSSFIYVKQPDGSDYRNSNTTWGTNYQSATSALFCMQAVNDFYRYYYNRNSFDNNFSQINVFAEDPSASGNAFWNGSEIHIGTAGAPFSDELITLDVLGHELTHGVTQYEAALSYQAESGALNESFSDIFGIMVEFYGKQNYNTGLLPNYLVGEEVMSGGLRDMTNPNLKNQPDTYNGTFWANTTGGDNGGVHTNSGVQNFWFYLLSEGGSGINDNGNNYCVTAIGRDKAAGIAYRSLTTYLSSNSTYLDARYYSIQSAIDLYGVNSNEVAQVTAAWYAVGVGSQFNGQMNIKNVVINSLQPFHYNSKIMLQNVITNPTAGLVVSSKTQIELLNDISFNSGSENELYIAPACLGGARMGNPNVNQNADNILSTRINEINKIDFMIMPNPTTDIFKLQTNSDLEYPKQIIIRNVLDQTIYNIENPDSFEYEFNLSKENAGIYMINVFYSDKVISKRIIKE